MGSMVPLPAPSEAQPRSKQPDAKSVSRTVDLGFSLQDEGQTAATAGAYPEPASALSTYRCRIISDLATSTFIRHLPSLTFACFSHCIRELRKLRSTLRIQVNCASGIDTATKHCAGTHGTRNPPVFLGRESRTDREVLLQKFSQSILLGGGSILQ